MMFVGLGVLWAAANEMFGNANQALLSSADLNDAFEEWVLVATVHSTAAVAATAGGEAFLPLRLPPC